MIDYESLLVGPDELLADARLAALLINVVVAAHCGYYIGAHYKSSIPRGLPFFLLMHTPFLLLGYLMVAGIGASIGLVSSLPSSVILGLYLTWTIFVGAMTIGDLYGKSAIVGSQRL